MGRSVRGDLAMNTQFRLFFSCANSAKTFPTVGLLLAFILSGSSLMYGSAVPPTGENAYCEKGDVPQFGGKDGPADLPKTCYYTAIDGTPSPGKQIRVYLFAYCFAKYYLAQ